MLLSIWVKRRGGEELMGIVHKESIEPIAIIQ